MRRRRAIDKMTKNVYVEFDREPDISARGGKRVTRRTKLLWSIWAVLLLVAITVSQLHRQYDVNDWEKINCYVVESHVQEAGQAYEIALTYAVGGLTRIYRYTATVGSYQDEETAELDRNAEYDTGAHLYCWYNSAINHMTIHKSSIKKMPEVIARRAGETTSWVGGVFGALTLPIITIADLT